VFFFPAFLVRDGVQCVGCFPPMPGQAGRVYPPSFSSFFAIREQIPPFFSPFFLFSLPDDEGCPSCLFSLLELHRR